jgi:YD repeat-containing protein
VKTQLLRDDDGQVTAVREGEHTRRVLRDERGRLIGVQGPSRADELADRANALDAEAGELRDELTRLDDQLTRAELKAEGWIVCGELHVNEWALRNHCQRLNLRLPVRVAWTDADADRGGFLKAGTGAEHVVMVHPHMPPEQTARTICHELAHAHQVESLGGPAFDRGYLLRTAEFEAQAEAIADQLMADDDPPLVRAATQPARGSFSPV